MAERELKVKFTGDTRGLERSLSSAERATKSAGDKIATAGKAMAAGFAVAGAAGFAFATKSVNTYKTVGGEVQKLKRYTGDSTEGASRLRAAFKLTGIDTEKAGKALGLFSKNLVAGKLDGFNKSLTGNRTQAKKVQAAMEGLADAQKDFADVQDDLHDKDKVTDADRRRLATSLEKVSTAQGKLTDASKGAGDAIGSLGFKTRDAQGHLLPMSVLLPKVADVFKNMPDGAEKTALAMDLFGKAGADMLPFLNKGADGIAELEEQADKLGVTLNDKDLDAIKESKKQSRLWSLAMEGLQIQIGRYVLPVLNDLMSWVNEEGIPRLHALGAKVKDWLVPQLQKFGDWWETDGKKKWEDFTTWINDTLLPALEDFGRWVLDHGLSALQVMVQWIADHPNWAGPIIAGLLTIIATIKLTSLAFVFTPWGFVITMVFAVAAALVYAYQTNEDFRKSVDAMGRGLVLTWGWIVTTVSGAVAAVTGFLNALGINHTNLALVVNLALDKIIFAWGLFSRAVASVYQAHLVIFGLLKSAYDGLRLGIAFALAIIEMLWARFVQSVGRFIAQLAGPIRMLLGFAQTAATVITSVFAAALAIIEQITDRIGDLVGRIAGWLNTLMSGLAALTRLPGAIGIPVPGGNAFVPGGNAFVPVPALAAGGIIPGSPWGTLVRAGENNRAEAIVPLSKMGGTTQNTYNITVDVAPGADPVRAGAAVVDAIRSYERANGRGWRVAPA